MVHKQEAMLKSTVIIGAVAMALSCQPTSCGSAGAVPRTAAKVLIPAKMMTQKGDRLELPMTAEEVKKTISKP